MAPRRWSATKRVVMNRFEMRNPFPPLKGFRTRLPHLGAYRYDVANSWMFNSGLIGMSPAHVPLLDDTLALIDALIGRAQEIPHHRAIRLVSEVLRLIPDAHRRSARQLPALLAGAAAHLYGQPDRSKTCRPTGTT